MMGIVFLLVKGEENMTYFRKAGSKVTRIVMCGIMTLAVLAAGAVNVQAAPAMVEKPDMRIYIDSKVGTYSNVPVIKNGRTLLALVDVMANLGVPNDKAHISWNGKEKSVTVSYNARSIYLKINSKTIRVNGTASQMDVEPVIFKNRTYIPIAFVSQSLGKKVIWDGDTQSVLIRDEVEYEKTRQLLEKVDLAMKAVTKSRADFTANVSMSAEGMNIITSSSGKVEADRLKKQMYILMNLTMESPEMESESLHMENYLGGNALHTRDTADGVWEKVEIPAEEFDRMFANEDMTSMQFNKALYAGLTSEPGAAPDEIILKGPVRLNGLMDKMGAEAGGLQQAIRETTLEMSVNSSTHLVNHVKMTVDGTIMMPEVNTDFHMDLSGIYKNFGGDFEITIPEGLK
jgi:hypothetical protein